MTTVTLRDIVTDEEMAAVLGLRRKPGQDRYLGSMESHFEDAIEDARACPRYWSVHDGEQLVGFVMISDNIPQAVLDAEPDHIVGPYFLWRLLIDAQYQACKALFGGFIEKFGGKDTAPSFFAKAA